MHGRVNVGARVPTYVHVFYGKLDSPLSSSESAICIEHHYKEKYTPFTLQNMLCAHLC